MGIRWFMVSYFHICNSISISLPEEWANIHITNKDYLDKNNNLKVVLCNRLHCTARIMCQQKPKEQAIVIFASSMSWNHTHSNQFHWGKHDTESLFYSKPFSQAQEPTYIEITCYEASHEEPLLDLVLLYLNSTQRI